jgi:hypothetical protein
VYVPFRLGERTPVSGYVAMGQQHVHAYTVSGNDARKYLWCARKIQRAACPFVTSTCHDRKVQQAHRGRHGCTRSTPDGSLSRYWHGSSRATSRRGLVCDCACCADLFPRLWCVWVSALTCTSTQRPTSNAPPRLLLATGSRGDPSQTPCECGHRKGVFRVANDWTRVYGAFWRTRSPFCSRQ